MKKKKYMPDRREDILYETFHAESEDCRIRREDLKLVIALNPDIDRIYLAMDENGKQMCLDLLEYMANQQIDCRLDDNGIPVFIVGPILRSKELTKEQLFENFL